MTVFGHLWSTKETRELFGDEGRTRIWLSVLGAVAAEQGELGLIPAGAAARSPSVPSAAVDLEAVGEETRRSGHSTLGLIRVLQRDLDDGARQWVSFGATVQDVADTWTGLVAQRMLAIASRDLAAIETSLVELAVRHRDAVMLGRTHGQPGLPITFGFKASVWIAEIRRHRARIESARPRLEVGQLAGAVGTLSAWGSAGPELQRRVLSRLGLGVPDISWLTARDRVAELVGLLALITGTLAKIGNEVYNLQRPEIGELREPATEGVVGSITMPQKRNPERSEHLVDPRARRPRRRRARARGPRLRARARRRRLEDRMVPPPARLRSRREPRSRSRPSSPRACRSTSSGCARTSKPSRATSSPSPPCSPWEPRSAPAERTS